MNLMKKLLAATGAVVALTACDSTLVTTPTNGPATTSASPTAATPLDPQSEALATYRQMWSDFAVAGTTSDWKSSRLSQHATGIALNKLTQSLQRDNDKGLVSKGAPVLSPSVSTLDPKDTLRKVVVTDCGDSTNWLKYRKDNGQLADDVPGGKRRINATVEKQADGMWKVSDFGVHEVGTC